jgi:hypothetical protein
MLNENKKGIMLFIILSIFPRELSGLGGGDKSGGGNVIFIFLLGGLCLVTRLLRFFPLPIIVESWEIVYSLYLLGHLKNHFDFLSSRKG